jgi:Zn-dependent protease with chaperone function
VKIEPQQFIARFVSRGAARTAKDLEKSSPLTDGDRVELTGAGLPPQAAFQQMFLALAAATPGGPPALAALSQGIARSLMPPEQEEQFAASLNDAFASRFVPPTPALQNAWGKIEGITGKHFSPPQLVNSPLIYAQADSRNLYIGTEALQSDLADPDVLIFALAHEEGHRRHRDSAGTRGLDTLLEICQDSPQMFKPALAAVREGHKENERQADAFAARVAAQLGCKPGPIAQFLEAIPEDHEHPSGSERAAAVMNLMRAEVG